MMDSFTSDRRSIAFCISSASPMAVVQGLCTIIRAVGLMRTVVPAMAITEAALAATPSI